MQPRMNLFCFSLSLFSLGATQVIELSSKECENQLARDKFRFVLFYSPWQSECKQKIDLLSNIAEIYEGNDNITIAKGDIYSDRKLGHRFKIEDYCVYKYFVQGSMVPESYTGMFTEDHIVEFIESKSTEKLQDTIFHRPLLELTSENFDRLVKDERKNVFVYFYTTWCLKCKDLSKVLTKVAKVFKNEPNCVIASIDGEKHYDKAIQSRVGVYPTFVLFPSSNKDGEVYLPGKFDENWSEKNMTNFLNVRCKTDRGIDGTLGIMAGRIEELDSLATYFIRNKGRREKALREAIEAVQKLAPYKRKAADYYVKIMRRIIADGDDFLDSEVDRISNLMLARVNLDQLDELAKKKNILQHFRFNRHEEL